MSLCQTEPFPKSEICNTPTIANYFDPIPAEPFFFILFLWSYFVRSISGEEDVFHRINAEAFPWDKAASPLSRALRLQTLHRLLQSPSPQAHVCSLDVCVCVCIMLPGVDITDAHYALCMRPGLFFMSLVIVIDIMWALSPACTRHMHRGLVEDDWYETPVMRRLRWRKATRMRSKRSEVLFFSQYWFDFFSSHQCEWDVWCFLAFAKTEFLSLC